MLRNGRFEQAETALRTIQRDHPADAQTLFLLGLAVQKQKRYSDARALFDQVLALQSTFPEMEHLPYAYGWCAYNLGDLARARTSFEEHLQHVPGEPDSVFALGVIALDEDRLDDAERLLNLAVSMQASAVRAGAPGAMRDTAKAHARLADLHIGRGDVAKGEQALRLALKLHPDHYEAWAKLARVLERTGRAAEASGAREQELAAKVRVGRLGAGSNQDGALPVAEPSPAQDR